MLIRPSGIQLNPSRHSAAVARTDPHSVQRYARCMQDGMLPPTVSVLRQVRRDGPQHVVEIGSMKGN
jgi:hypothetical protein